MDYGEIIKSAFWISLRNPYLWFFGLFAGSTSYANAPNLSGNLPNDVPTGGGGSDFSSALQANGGLFDDVALIAAIVAVGVLVFLVLLLLVVFSQGALAESVAALDRGGARRGFGSAFRSGLSNFWRVLGYSVVFFLIGIGLFLLIGGPLVLLSFGVFTATESVGARVGFVALLALVGILLLFLVFIPVRIIGQYALRGVVLDRTGVFGSIGGGYRLFRRNIGRSLLVWLINLGISLGVLVVLLILGLIVGLILFLPTIALGIAGYSTAAVVTGIVAALILVPLFLVASGAIGTFGHAYWTLAYLRLTSSPNAAAPQPAV